MSVLTEKYSGIVINQNQRPRADDKWPMDFAFLYQEFFLPDDYVRGTTGTEKITPPLSGWQLLVDVADDASATATIEWTCEYRVDGVGWIKIAEGKTTGSHVSGRKVWIDMFFDEAVDVSGFATNRFRLGFRTVSDVVGAWYSVPNPLALAGFSKAYAGDGITPLSTGGEEFSFCFRVLALVADEGVDHLGNTYRSAVITSSPYNVSTRDGEVKDKTWLSKPNPSRFAIESLYFDLSSTGVPVAVDRILLDPLTPGVYFSVYFSDEGEPGKTDEEWEDKLWTRVPQNFSATNREVHALSTPIVTRYIKIEFTQLQARHYAPGDFATPIKYKKHPKWVLDYFLARLDADNANNTLIPGRVAVVFDAIDLAYNYYLDDLAQEPNLPVEVDPNFSVESFLNLRTDPSDLVDDTALEKVATVLAPYQQHPATFAKRDYLLGAFVQRTQRSRLNYPVERIPPVTFNKVENFRDQSVVVDNSFPVMFFYLTCRHKYREVVAALSHDRAYFAGIREISFTRDSYTAATDAKQYVEVAGDLQSERNDFAFDSGVLRV